MKALRVAAARLLMPLKTCREIPLSSSGRIFNSLINFGFVSVEDSNSHEGSRTGFEGVCTLTFKLGITNSAAPSVSFFDLWGGNSRGKPLKSKSGEPLVH